MANTKLHPIYVALDSHQYSRAVKLALALPDSNVLGKALLAHAYAKAGQKYLALTTLNKVLGGGEAGGGSAFLYELKYELDHCLESTIERQNGSSLSANLSVAPAPPEPAPASNKKGGKKGKKKPAPAPKQQSAPASPAEMPSSADIDLIDQLNAQPSLPSSPSDEDGYGNDALACPPPEKAITDETTLATLAVTLQNLKLSLTAYQMYAWAVVSIAASSLGAAATHSAATIPTTSTPDYDDYYAILTKTFALGLNVLAVPAKWNDESQTRLERHVLANMQAVALQWARLAVSQSQSSSFDAMLATAWAAQSALWQLQWLPDDDPQRAMILPRLAESMARRLLQQEREEQALTSSASSAEIRLLCLRTLEVQSKWDDMLLLLEALPVEAETNDSIVDTAEPNGTTNNELSSSSPPPPASSDFGVALTTHEILVEKARLLRRLSRWEEARTIYHTLLQKHRSPDDWSCWKGHLETSIFLDDTMEATQSLAEKMLEEEKGEKMQLRGPHLITVEIAAERVRRNSSDEAYRSLGNTIEGFARVFAHRVSCAFSDLEHYLGQLLRTEDRAAKEVTVSLLEFADSLRKANITHEAKAGEDGEVFGNKERQSKLRAYTFAIKFTHKLLSGRSDAVVRFLPDWTEIVREWQATLSLSSSNEGEETQRELKPGDDLILLAVQQLLYQAQQPDHNANNANIVSAILLESAIRHSPDNAYLKFLAIEVYYQMDAVARSWELFQMIGLKHIQLDSCTFTILPYLLEGGLYNETIEVCSALLRFQGGTARDCGDYAGRAMGAGTLSKANEFMEFQRLKMNRSLTLQYCKGLILDCAPLLATPVPRMKHDDNPLWKGGLGISQGIVGAKDDMERAIQMVVETHNPYAALSIVSWANACGSLDHVDDLSDNRDLSVLAQFSSLIKPTTQSKAAMIQETLLRGHVHGILIRATLCVDAMRGPKKGKVVKSSAALERRTQSLLGCVLAASEFFDNQMVILTETVLASQGLLRVFLDLCRLLAIINAGMPKKEEDTMEQREDRATDMLNNHCIVNLKQAREQLSSSKSVKVVCSLLPSCVVPMFAIFRMCSDVCTAYGWGKRKRKSKKIAGAMAELAGEFNLMLQHMMNGIKTLPASESELSATFTLTEKELGVLDESDIHLTAAILNIAKYRARIRIEPILQEMDEFLEGFDVSDE